MDSAAHPKKTTKGGSETDEAVNEKCVISTPFPDALGSASRSAVSKPEFIDYVKSMAFGLLFGCPMGEAVEDCVFKEMRKVKQTRDGKFIYNTICSRSSGELEDMVGRHRMCLMKREGVNESKQVGILKR